MISESSLPSPTRRREDLSADSDSDTSEPARDDSAGPVTFPSRLRYSLDHLDEDKREHILETLDQNPRLTLQCCTSRDRQAVFQVAELVDYHSKLHSWFLACPALTRIDATPPTPGSKDFQEY